MPTLTIGGEVPAAKISFNRHQPSVANQRFGYALIRLVESAYMAGAATYLYEKRARWIDNNPGHPLLPERVTKYDLVRREMIRHEGEVDRWCRELDVASREVTEEMIQMAIDAYGEELLGLRESLRSIATRGLCWQKLGEWYLKRESGQRTFPLPPGEPCPF